MLKTQTRFMVYSHLGHCSLEETSRCLTRCLPQVFDCYLPLLNYIPLSFTDIPLWQSMPFSYRNQTGGENIWPSCGGISVFALPLHWFQLPCHSQAELSSQNSLKACGKDKKLHHDITFLLVLAEEEAVGGRNYGLSTIWVNPSQARVPSMEEAVDKLTA